LAELEGETGVETVVETGLDAALAEEAAVGPLFDELIPEGGESTFTCATFIEYVESSATESRMEIGDGCVEGSA
jgi:hypothetical protein